MRKFGVYKNNDSLLICLGITNKNEYILSELNYEYNKNNMFIVFNDNDNLDEVPYRNLFIKDNLLNEIHGINFITYDILLDSFEIEIESMGRLIYLHKDLKSDWESYNIIIKEMEV